MGGKAGGAWVFVPQKPSFGKGKGKGKKVKGKGKGKARKPFSSLSEERKAEIRARHEDKQAELGREEQGSQTYVGELVQRRKKYGWIKPANFGKLPSDVQERVKDMVK